jgi:hypothetical protein
MNSFINLDNWLKECKKYQGNKLLSLLIGNKSDLKSQVSSTDIERFCNLNKMSYYEVSGLNYDLVDKCMKEFAVIIGELLVDEQKSKKK